jgi:hypothetical protein
VAQEVVPSKREALVQIPVQLKNKDKKARLTSWILKCQLSFPVVTDTQLPIVAHLPPTYLLGAKMSSSGDLASLGSEPKDGPISRLQTSPQRRRKRGCWEGETWDQPHGLSACHP